MLSVKQGGIKYHFLSPWYDTTWDWTLGLLNHWRTLNPLGHWPSYLFVGWNDMAWSCTVIFPLIFSMSLNLILVMNIQLNKQEKFAECLVYWAWRVLHLRNPVFHQKLLVKKYWNWQNNLFGIQQHLFHQFFHWLKHLWNISFDITRTL